MEANHEIFYYLEKSKNLMFFMNVEKSPNSNYVSNCGALYLLVRREGFLEKNEELIIFNLLKDGSLIAICIHHGEFIESQILELQELSLLLEILYVKMQKKSTTKIVVCIKGECFKCDSLGLMPVGGPSNVIRAERFLMYC